MIRRDFVLLRPVRHKFDLSQRDIGIFPAKVASQSVFFDFINSHYCKGKTCKPPIWLIGNEFAPDCQYISYRQYIGPNEYFSSTLDSPPNASIRRRFRGANIRCVLKVAPFRVSLFI